MEELLLVLRGAPATLDEELDAVVCGTRCGLAQGVEESWIKEGYTRNPVIKDRRAVGDGAVSLAKRTTVLIDRCAVGDGAVSLATRTTVLTATDLDG